MKKDDFEHQCYWCKNKGVIMEEIREHYHWVCEEHRTDKK